MIVTGKVITIKDVSKDVRAVKNQEYANVKNLIAHPIFKTRKKQEIIGVVEVRDKIWGVSMTSTVLTCFFYINNYLITITCTSARIDPVRRQRCRRTKTDLLASACGRVKMSTIATPN